MSDQLPCFPARHEERRNERLLGAALDLKGNYLIIYVFKNWIFLVTEVCVDVDSVTGRAKPPEKSNKKRKALDQNDSAQPPRARRVLKTHYVVKLTS